MNGEESIDGFHYERCIDFASFGDIGFNERYTIAIHELVKTRVL